MISHIIYVDSKDKYSFIGYLHTYEFRSASRHGERGHMRSRHRKYEMFLLQDATEISDVCSTRVSKTSGY